jgi:hypothetical protein
MSGKENPIPERYLDNNFTVVAVTASRLYKHVVKMSRKSAELAAQNSQASPMQRSGERRVVVPVVGPVESPATS